MPVITLTTDFGLQDPYVGILKGVIWGICPAAQVADISHAIAPQNILQGALVLERAYSYFPEGSVHLAVVDPGVGTSRRAIAALLGGHYFVGPDNGLFTPILRRAQENDASRRFVSLTDPKYWLPGVSHTFHGRDIFAPAAAHLACGVPLEELGEPIDDPVRLELPAPLKTASGWEAHIIYIDTFGNLATDLPAVSLPAPGEVLARLGGYEVRGMIRSYAEKAPGDLVALVNSAGLFEIAVVNGSAARFTGAEIGDTVEIIFS